MVAMNDEKKTIQGFETVLSLFQSGQRDEAMVKCHEIANAHSSEHAILRLCARIAEQCGKLDIAVQWIKDAILLDGSPSEYHLAMGRIFLQIHRVDEAIASFEKVLILDSTHAPAYLQLGRCYFENREYQKSLKHIQKSIQKDPDYAESYFWMGMVCSKQNKRRQALGCLEKASALDPTFAEAHNQLGLLYLEEGKLARSRDCFYHVIAGDQRDWRAWGNLCVVLRELGELNEARRSGLRATSMNPESFHAWHNLGNVNKDMGRYHDSISCYQKALSLNAESGLTHTGLGISYHRTGATDSAVDSFKMALKFNPSEGTAISNLLNTYMLECNWDKSFHYEKMIHKLTIESLRTGQVPAETPFINLSRCDAPDFNMDVARAWSRDIEAKMYGTRNSLGFQYTKDHRRKIRIGYLSNNFGDHPTAHLTRRLYQLHDRRRFEIFCFSYGSADNSHYRHAIQDGCDNFIDIRESSHAQAARAINDHGVDILVDLVGFMKGQRMAIAALRPAPIQVRWLGMAGTSGAEFFHYLITDRIVTPENQSRFYTEKFVYLPHCYQINDNQAYLDENNYRKSDFSLPEDAFVFCCFNTSYKIDAEIFAVWMNILRRSPNSVLWLMADRRILKENLYRAVSENGISENRLILTEKIPKHNHLSRLSLADLGLDTRRVNGAASTSDALWAGVPVLTIQGKHFASRMSASILKAVGLNEMVTYSLKDYENRAVQLAEEKNTLSRIRSTLKATGIESHLFKTEKFVDYLETAYETIWKRYLDMKKHCLVDITEVPTRIVRR